METLIILFGLSAGAALAAQFHQPKPKPPSKEKWDKEWEVKTKTRIKYRRNH